MAIKTSVTDINILLSTGTNQIKNQSKELNPKRMSFNNGLNY